ncbi:hypothetical protein J2W56_006602 [Nocardia kruczakiae]|uniref:Uncharacterized protein n=1 Tax=Nocardia kruczakiae TaxID=261477 RepID=A0ABU1XQJ1_9NOCA|nr:hypothetical protein [Nocardia kruczakiae]MDR7172836.1 hypothetical protein [Nocardia kruczakiae]
MRALIERSSLGEDGPRRLRARTRRDQLDRIRQLLRQDPAMPDPVLAEPLAHRIYNRAQGLPRRTSAVRIFVPDPAVRPAAQVVYLDPPLHNYSHRNDSHTMIRVADGLRRLESCSS